MRSTPRPSQSEADALHLSDLKPTAIAAHSPPMWNKMMYFTMDLRLMRRNWQIFGGAVHACTSPSVRLGGGRCASRMVLATQIGQNRCLNRRILVLNIIIFYLGEFAASTALVMGRGTHLDLLFAPCLV